MNFKLLRKKLISFHKILIAPPKRWRAPSKCEILIYDAEGADIFAPYLLNYNVEVVSTRGEFINIRCLLRAILTLRFWKGQPVQSYVETYIRMASPKVVLTYVDNDSRFYTISKRFPGIKTIFVQNGIRSVVGDIFGTLTQSDSYHVDYMLVNNNVIGKYYNRFVSGECISIGSFKSNSVDRTDQVLRDSVVFISQYIGRPKHNVPLFTEPDGTHVSFEQFYAAESLVLPFLKTWCAEHRKLLRICGRGIEREGPEKAYYADYLRGSKWEYVPRIDEYSSYKLADTAEIVVFIDSTLGSEALSRGKKIAALSCRMALPDQATAKLGWPINLPDNGPFWTSDADEKQFRRIMDYLNTVSDEEWRQTQKLYAGELMVSDPGNSKFVSLLARLLPKSDRVAIAGNSPCVSP